MMKITCAILCYNYGRYLSQAIESCLNQEKGDYVLEVIIIDDGSTDNTPDVCNQYARSIKYFRSKNEGFGSSLTKAVQYASSEIICILDADDYFLPNKINVVVEQFKKQTDLLFLYHDQISINEEGKILELNVKGGNTSTHVFNKKAAISF